MSGLLSGLQIGLSTLMAHQQAINVTSHNIANVNTPGYQRQRINLNEMNAPSGRINPPMMGMGVYAKGVSRFATPFIDQQIRRHHAAIHRRMSRDRGPATQRRLQQRIRDRPPLGAGGILGPRLDGKARRLHHQPLRRPHRQRRKDQQQGQDEPHHTCPFSARTI